jgi:hypothetical protein
MCALLDLLRAFGLFKAKGDTGNIRMKATSQGNRNAVGVMSVKMRRIDVRCSGVFNTTQHQNTHTINRDAGQQAKTPHTYNIRVNHSFPLPQSHPSIV